MHTKRSRTCDEVEWFCVLHLNNKHGCEACAAALPCIHGVNQLWPCVQENVIGARAIGARGSVRRDIVGCSPCPVVCGGYIIMCFGALLFYDGYIQLCCSTAHITIVQAFPLTGHEDSCEDAACEDGPVPSRGWGGGGESMFMSIVLFSFCMVTYFHLKAAALPFIIAHVELHVYSGYNSKLQPISHLNIAGSNPEAYPGGQEEAEACQPDSRADADPDGQSEAALHPDGQSEAALLPSSRTLCVLHNPNVCCKVCMYSASAPFSIATCKFDS